jgi:PAS domain S-box-containing protein
MVEPFNLVLLVSLIALIFLLPRLWAVRHAAGAVELMLCSLACGVWSFGYYFEILVPGLAEKLFWAKFEYLGIATVTVWVLLFIIRYTGLTTRLNFWHMLALLFIPLMTIIFTATNEAHAWMWTSIALQPGWASAPLALGHGSWFWVEIAYSYILLLGGTAIMLRFIFRTQQIYLFQSLIMLVAMLVPWIGNALYILNIRPGPNLDLTPIAFTITNIGLVVGFMRYRLLDILPVAYSSIFSFMSDGVVVLDAKDRIVDINPAARRIFYRRDPALNAPTRPIGPAVAEPQVSLIGHTINDLLPGRVKGLAGQASSAAQELRLSQGPGLGDRVYTFRTSPILNRRQAVTGQVLIFSDITQLKQAEEQMLLQVTALESAVNGIVITDSQGAIEWANPAFTHLTGYTLEEALGQNPRILKSGKLPDEYYRDLWQTILAGKVWHGEMVNRRKDGSFYDEEMTITPLVNAQGAVEHFIAIKQDVSVRKRAEEQMRLAHEQALESNRFKTQLINNVSHDMRTPLAAIMGFSDMLIAGFFGEMKPEQANAMDEIQDSANQLLLFINNLIGQAQFESGKIIIRPKLFQVEELVEACRGMISQPANKKGLAAEYIIDPALPQTLTGDLYWLRQIALNLTNNAVKFTDHGSVKIHLYLADPCSWAIEVADTGVGISAQAQASIFELFAQVNGSSEHERGGSGLGLVLVKELTSLMGGRIGLVSRPEGGSTFTVYFPMISKD